MTQKESSIKDIDGGPLIVGKNILGYLAVVQITCLGGGARLSESNPCLGGAARLSELREQAIVISI